MNRISTLLMLLALALSAQAQSLQFYFHGQPLEDGTTVTIEATTDDWGDLVCATNPADAPNDGLILKNLTGANVNGVATLTFWRGTMQPQLVQWCMGGSCIQVPCETKNTKDKDFTVPAGSSIQTQFDATPGAVGEMSARIVVNANMQTTTVYVRLVNPDPAQTAQRFMRRSVIEEFTGTWCDNCPRGLVGVQRLQADFGDRCIPIHAHVGANGTDPMQINSYADLNGSAGIPTSFIDRGSNLDPYPGTQSHYHYGIDIDFSNRLAEPTEADLQLKAEWDDMQRDVVYTATTTFNINSATAPYRLIFVLLENGLTGTGKAWAQANAYSPDATGRVTSYQDEDMAYWCEAPNYVTDMVYDHVPVNTKGLQSGISGSIQAPIVSGQPQTYTDKVTTYKQTVIQNKENLYAVAMVINTETGRIVNAAKADIQPYGASGIRGIGQSDNSPLTHSVYDLQGRKLSNGSITKGLYIQNGRKFVVTK